MRGEALRDWGDYYHACEICERQDDGVDFREKNVLAINRKRLCNLSLLGPDPVLVFQMPDHVVVPRGATITALDWAAERRGCQVSLFVFFQVASLVET